MDQIVERFLKYISFDTKSDEESEACPSTEGQRTLGKELVKELKAMGLDNVRIDPHSYVYASLPQNAEDFPSIGLIAHMDTSPDLAGRCLHPKCFLYQGGDIPLNEEFTSRVSDFPFLKELIGQTLITTDGTTLLGADDKAGIAIIMTAVDFFIRHPEIPHGNVQIAFTPDEEIGRGSDLFDVKNFGADFAFTVDGGPIGGLEYETFNAASAKIKIQGKNVHPGSAKKIMINALEVAMDLHSLLPVQEKPQFTSGREGFFHLMTMEGSVEEAVLTYIIRDHDRENFEKRKKIMEDAVNDMNGKYGQRIFLEMKDSYYNMAEEIQKHPQILDLAKTAMKKAGVKPVIEPVRGGTDGSGLTFKGLPTPNLFTGGYNYHGRYELLSVDQMKKAKDVVIKIIEEAKGVHLGQDA